jgi:capsular polysaccharide biosynthesis protein
MEGRHVGAVLWRQWPIALLVTVLTGAAVAVGVMMAPKTYTATAEISALSSVQGSNDDQDSLRSTLGELANSREVVADVEEELDGARSGDGLPGALAPDDGGDGVAVVDEAAQHGCTHEPGSPGEQDLHGVVNRDGPFGVPACPLRGRFSRGSP